MKQGGNLDNSEKRKKKRRKKRYWLKKIEIE